MKILKFSESRTFIARLMLRWLKLIATNWLRSEMGGNGFDWPSRSLGPSGSISIENPREPQELNGSRVKNQISARSGRSGRFSNMLSPSGRPVGNVPVDLWLRLDRGCLRKKKRVTKNPYSFVWTWISPFWRWSPKRHFLFFSSRTCPWL